MAAALPVAFAVFLLLVAVTAQSTETTSPLTTSETTASPQPVTAQPDYVPTACSRAMDACFDQRSGASDQSDSCQNERDYRACIGRINGCDERDERFRRARLASSERRSQAQTCGADGLATVSGLTLILTLASALLCRQ